MDSRLGRVSLGIFFVSLIGGCSTAMVQPKPTIANIKYGSATSDTPQEGATVMEQAALIAANDLFASAKAPSCVEKAQTAFRTSRALLDQYCGEYLDALGSANQKSGNERRQTSIIAGFTSAIMGLTGSSAKSVAGVASTFSFAQSSLDAFAYSYLFSDAASSITKLVHDAQSAYLQAAQANMATLDYPGAVSLLGGYEQICRPTQIRGLIDQAINAARIVVETPANLPDDAAVSNLLGGLMGALGTPVTEGDAIALYAWFKSDATGRAAVQAKSAFVASRTSTPALSSALEAKISSLFLPLGVASNPIAKRWSPVITNMTSSSGATDPAALMVVPTLRVRQ